MPPYNYHARPSRWTGLLRSRIIITITVLAITISVVLSALAAPSGGDISIDYAAAAPFTYNHLTGAGGQYNQGGTNDVVEAATTTAATSSCSSTLSRWTPAPRLAPAQSKS